MRSAIFNKMNFTPAYDDANESRASYLGITIKTLVFLLVMILSAALGMFVLSKIDSEKSLSILIGVLIASCVVSLISGFMSISERLAIAGGFIFSVATGFMLGTISKLLDYCIPGISLLAVIGTLIVFFVVFLLFSTGVLRATSRLFGICISVLVCAAVLALVTFIMSFFFDYGTYLPILVAIEAFYVLYGAITLVFNFEDAKAHVDAGLSKKSEWQVAFGFVITIYYIYIEILRLLMYILPYITNSRR